MRMLGGLFVLFFCICAAIVVVSDHNVHIMGSHTQSSALKLNTSIFLIVMAGIISIGLSKR